MHFKHSFQMGGLLLVSWALATGCTVTSTNTTDTCSLDTAVACGAGQAGYSCSGTQTPTVAVDSTLNCGAGVSEASGDLGYCCTATATGTNLCTVDAKVSCPTSTGYTCSGTDTPEASDPTLSCGTGVTESDGTLGYCCTTSATGGTDTCTADSGVKCDGSTGYTCTGATAPDATDTTLDCGAGVAGSTTGTLAYCCAVIPAGSTCANDDSVVGCTGGSFGFSCTGTDTPSDADPSLDCSVPTADGSASLYCCVSFSTTASTCMPDSTVDGCMGDSYGFSCTGTDTPTDAQPSLNCSDPAPGPASSSLYCCTNG